MFRALQTIPNFSARKKWRLRFFHFHLQIANSKKKKLEPYRHTVAKWSMIWPLGAEIPTLKIAGPFSLFDTSLTLTNANYLVDMP